MNQLFYHTPLSQDAIVQLQQQEFESLKSAIYPETSANFFLVVNKPARKYWITNDSGLADQNELAEVTYNQNILPITLNEIQSWKIS